MEASGSGVSLWVGFDVAKRAVVHVACRQHPPGLHVVGILDAAIPASHPRCFRAGLFIDATAVPVEGVEFERVPIIRLRLAALATP